MTESRLREEYPAALAIVLMAKAVRKRNGPDECRKVVLSVRRSITDRMGANVLDMGANVAALRLMASNCRVCGKCPLSRE